ncbi:SDR family NAD(P)-dependent oxidoreductase [Ectopseudomonas oleovorans]|uniref:Short-chain dehydrogenase/reductase SDR n=1 Tax=Ectopseudomonas oleovorans (strain CECT 5344) TaxID=1182590 RepID=W6RDJ3_ECTO5|nr:MULTISPECIES: SDR family NAD(P)-dependent oxidoreductase [Pseudomonas]CDR90559.1 Short-chain dehydrogenase/reductase SDR [Pseudomonas oleovorans]MDH0625388.1 SDR family NAD(P)-dependent oxidoreductase [Pseudomonas chengduensis]MDH1283070.1 SDR family NAD(P)-dependent oxidoreductase [Pseudomonas chengduensis]MDH1667659.1 SDR family NAD(P)-dependent oxidoreductase [Pseudomonas chengduensis]CDM39934.1 Short-chain dehydrogenase/reductase SDR [Pseudomonas oleovorans CECT 5344]
MTLHSLGNGYKALVIGASGTIGQAFCQLLRADPSCAGVRELSRSSSPALDLETPTSIAEAAAALADEGPYQLILHTAGLLHRPGIAPEKSLAAIDADALQAVFQVNALGPALVLRHFLPLLDKQGAMAMLSAKVGSIGDNRLGGWYAYRASKAALNMLIKTAAIELARSKPKARLLSLHPGTVISPLSQPFRGASAARPAELAAAEMLRVIDALGPEHSGSFHAYDGQPLPW